MEWITTFVSDPRTGAGAVFAVMWFLERKERLVLQAGRDALLERVLKAMDAGTLTMNVLKDLFERAAARQP